MAWNDSVRLEILCTHRANLVVRAESMKAANASREYRGEAQAYAESAFASICNELENVEVQMASLFEANKKGGE